MTKNNNNKSYFKKGAWLFSLEKEMTEGEFINRAGGIEALTPFLKYQYVSLVVDKTDPVIVGHRDGRTISLAMQEHGHEKWQTMEWK